MRRMRRLKVLHLQGNRLSELPSWIGELSSLEELRLDYNELRSLPSELADLKHLTSLDLSGKQKFQSLPAVVCEMPALRSLSLESSGFDSLPDEIGFVRSLQTLNLAHSSIRQLPSSVGDLANLQLLNLSYSQIQDLPRRLAPLLRAALQVRIVDTPLPVTYQGLVSRGAAALATYLESLGDAYPMYEAKVLLVGEGNVGKSSLVSALLNEPFVVNRPTTHGIEIHTLKFVKSDLPAPLTLRAWDFGGQEVYRVTHQFFFSDRALYLVVWNPREGVEQNEVEGWLRRIRLRVGSQAPTLLVATHGDERRPEINYPALREEFPGMLQGNIAVDNQSGTGIPQLRSTITAEAANLPQVGQLLSGRWIDARNDVLRLAKTAPQISYDEFSKICALRGLGGFEIVTFAELLHDLGQIIYYGDDEGLKDIVVLNPEWLTKAIGYVLEDATTRESGGVLDHRRLKDIWLDNEAGKQSYERRHHPYFLRLMEKFDVSYRLDEVDQQRSLVAQLVPADRPQLSWTRTSPLPEGLRSLSLVCELSEPAPGLVAWLTVRHHRAATGHQWRTGVLLRHPVAAYSSEALIELRNERRLHIDVRAPSPDLFFNVLRDSVEDLVRSRWPGLNYRLSVPCPTRTSAGSPCNGQFRLDALLRYRQRGGTLFPCQDCVQDHDVAALLTGFANTGAPRQEEFERLQEQLVEVSGGVSRVEALAADSANSVRRVLKAVGTEVTDCPRIFSLREGKRTIKSVMRVGQMPVRLTLWCEHPGEWHPVDHHYDFPVDRQWWSAVKPYASVVLRSLRLIGALSGTVVDTGLVSVDSGFAQTEIAGMSGVLKELPPAVEEGDKAALLPARTSLSVAEGESLRAFRRQLFLIDPQQSFGGLRRVHSAAGDLLWVCSSHYPLYDPGLPVLEGDFAEAEPTATSLIRQRSGSTHGRSEATVEERAGQKRTEE